MSTLDLPQHVYVCTCGARGSAVLECCPSGAFKASVKAEPTLLRADFEAEMTALSLAVHPMPSDDEVWDYLESHTDTAPTNREAIHNAIRAVGREMADRSKARDGL